MKDEVEGDTIVEFISGGAKNYGYQTARGKVECKVRGFTLNVRGREVLNYESMKDHILSTLEDEEDHRDCVERWKQQPSGGDQLLSPRSNQQDHDKSCPLEMIKLLR